MKIPFLLLLASWLPTPLLAGGVADAPTGFVTITCLGKSDTIVSMPVTRPTEYTGEGTMSVVTSGSVGTVTFSGASFTASQFKYDSSSQTNTYYLFVAGGDKEGSYYTITDNDTTSVTVNLNGDDVSAITADTEMKIIPYWTLGTVFASGEGVNATTGSTEATQILLPNNTGTGTNLGTSATYFYSSTTSTWLLDGDSTQATQDDVVLYPDTYFIVRNKVSTATSITATGSVVTNQLMLALTTQTAGRQDNAVAITRPVAVTLKESGLVSSGAFTKTTASTPGDKLLVFNNKKAKLNKAPAKTYLYKNGAWRLVGSSGNHNTDAIFTPGTGVLIRKAKTTDGSSALWINPAPFTY